MKRTILFALVMIGLHTLWAQSVITGTIVDSESRKPVSGAHASLSGTKSGCLSHPDGTFSLAAGGQRQVTLVIQQLGYAEEQLPLTLRTDTTKAGTILLIPQPVPLDEIIITDGIESRPNTPLTVVNLSREDIINETGDRPLPLIMNSIAGVFSTPTGGGSGDAQLSIRGFGQENIGILLNGIPISSVENGLIYWSNWLGMSRTMAQIQVQKGPGLSNVVTNAVGGTVNIVTTAPSEEPFISLSSGMTSYGNYNHELAINTGKQPNGWNILFRGSYYGGAGYVDATFVRGGSYFLALNKSLKNNDKLTITLLGAPEEHGQRTIMLSHAEQRYFGNLYNKEWGSLDGQLKNASVNFYHKPVLGINHYHSINNNTLWANGIYLTTGYGGGLWSESFNYAPSIFSFKNTSGQLDWRSIYDNNEANDSWYSLANGDSVSHFAWNAGTRYLASHVEGGWISSIQAQLSPTLTFSAGAHYRYFNSWVREELTDLMGAQVFIDDYGWAVDGVAGRNQLFYPGDIIKVNNNSIINFGHIHSMIRYDGERTIAYLSMGANTSIYQRIDRYNYITDQKSGTYYYPGVDIRGGSSLAMANHHTIYLNGAFISRAPYFKFVFGNYNNTPVQSLHNERFATIEAGYRFTGKNVDAEISGYLTRRNEVSLLSYEYVQLEDNSYSRSMVNGLSALHKGIEGKLNWKWGADNQLTLTGMLGDFHWMNDIDAWLLNNDNVVTDTIRVMAAGLPVGGAAQQQLALQYATQILKRLDLQVQWNWFGQAFATFDPATRTNPSDRSMPYRIPSWSELNLYAGTDIQLSGVQLHLQLNAFNVLNNVHLMMAEDGIDHDLNTLRGFWSPGRTIEFSLSLRL